jgi:hypothetical protein
LYVKGPKINAGGIRIKPTTRKTKIMSETIATIGPNKWSSARTGGEEKPVFTYELSARSAGGGERRDIPAATQLARMILALPGRNSTTAAKLVFSVIGKMLAFSCVALLANLRVSAADKDDAASAPMPIACEVRYHFRERIADAKPGEKQFSAPATERESLPPSRLVDSDGQQAQVVEGRVAHLPSYRFAIKLSRSEGTDAGKLEVNILDAAGKPLSGYPQTMANPFADASEQDGKVFEIPITKYRTQMIEKTLLAKDQRLTYVGLVIKPSP